MLAYVFWHRPADGVAVGESETMLKALHGAQAAHPRPDSASRTRHGE